MIKKMTAGQILYFSYIRPILNLPGVLMAKN